MRILITNYRYYLSGGPERYLFSVKKLLEDKGHITIPFSVKSKRNVFNELENYFISAIDSKDSAYFHEYDFKIPTIKRTLERSFYSLESYNCARRIIQKTRPDISYVLHFMNKISPSIFKAFKDEGVPVILRLSDFSLVCPEAHFLCHGNICEACKHGKFFYATKNRCIKNSYIGSFIKSMSWYFHRWAKLYDSIDAFISPTKFTKTKMVEAGFPRRKIHVVNTFTESIDSKPNFDVGDYILYFGRSSKEKGLDLLVDEYCQLSYPKPQLKIVTQKEYFNRSINNRNIEFLPFTNNRDDLFRLIRNSMFVIVPSICYENLPNAILESFLNGKPVIASKLGSIPEIVQDHQNGILFDPNERGNLKLTIEKLISDRKKIRLMGEKAYSHAVTKFNSDAHYIRLLEVFKKFL